MNVRLWYALAPLVLSSLCMENRGIMAPIILPDTPILRTVDKMGFINIGQIFTYAQNIIVLLQGTKNPEQASKLAAAFDLQLPMPLIQGNKRTNRFAIVPYGDEYLTVRELAALEENGTGDPVLLEKALKFAIDDYEKLSQDYVEEIQTAKDYMTKLIDHWCTARNRPDSILRDWGSIDNSECESMHKTLNSFSILTRFLDDLLPFLRDLIENCPISHKKYRESLKKN
ncbi:TPA: hypothetical protein DDZ86_01640 [Candidatus Dependentiae bacterium]|nr:MAG: hypothetical protein UW09_C0001G0308 [candidate division TM6 bacterium GW2011_GWF2_43_87]HBL98327.1 hypothetical protein [Candidatus Dependentiae bacterium]